MKTINVVWISLAIAVMLFFTGFFVGRSTIKITSKTVTVTTIKKVPYAVEKKIDRPVPYAVEHTKYLPGEIQKVDSAAILSDYELTRKYDLDFSTDSLGSFKVKAVVNENKLVSATSSIQPIIKTVVTTNTVYKVPALQFYGLVGSSIDLKTNQVQAGIDISQKYMIGASAIRFEIPLLGNQFGYTINVGIKF